jgi:hypothetical protein
MSIKRAAWIVLSVLCAVAIYGFVHEDLFAQDLWRNGGLERWGWFSLAFWIPALVLMWLRPAWLIPAALIFAFAYSEWWCWQFFDPRAPVAVVYFLGSCFFLGRIAAKRADAMTAVLVGLAAWIFVLSIAVHFPVNRAWVYGVAFAVPYGAGFFRGVRFTTGAQVPKGPIPGFAILIYILLMHWVVALKPEVSADGLAMHLAIPDIIARQHLFPFDFRHYAWSLMPMGGDFAFTGVYLLGGEMAARLLNVAMLVLIAVMVYRGARRWLPPDRAALATALFASTPLVQLVTGSLFVENIWAVFITGAVLVLWDGEVTLAAILLGAAFSTKVGTSAFLLPAGIAAWLVLRPRPNRMRTVLAATGLFVLFATPPYLNAWIKSGNPIFPFANTVFRSPYFQTTAPLVDGRYHQPGSWDELYRMAFRSSEFIEGQNGALGFQYFLLLVPLLLLLWNRKAPRGPVLIGVAGAIVTFASLPNLRYLFPAMPLVSIGIAWMMAEIPWLAVGAVALIGLNLWFLPAAGWYHTDFAAFSGDRLEEYMKVAAPQRKLIDVANEIAPGEPVAVFQSASIAGLRGEAYVDTWHTWDFYRGLLDAPDTAHIAEMFRRLKIRYLITPVPPQTDSVMVGQFLETWTAPTGKESGKSQFRMLLAEPVAKPREIHPAGAGSYEDVDPQIEYTGAWLHDHQFQKASGGSLTYSDTPGDRASFFFTGRAIAYVYTLAFNRGKVEVSIDRKVRAVVDLYSKDLKWQQRSVFGGLEAGPHTLELRILEEKNAKSSGQYVDVDRFVVDPEIK